MQRRYNYASQDQSYKMNGTKCRAAVLLKVQEAMIIRQHSQSHMIPFTYLAPQSYSKVNSGMQ